MVASKLGEQARTSGPSPSTLNSSLSSKRPDMSPYYPFIGQDRHHDEGDLTGEMRDWIS